MGDRLADALRFYADGGSDGGARAAAALRGEDLRDAARDFELEAADLVAQGISPVSACEMVMIRRRERSGGK